MGCAAGIPVQPHDAKAGQGQAGHGCGAVSDLAKPHVLMESSWDSATWNRDVPKGVPLKPNRILHERHLKVMNQFRREVEVAPDTFSDIISARRQTSSDS